MLSKLNNLRIGVKIYAIVGLCLAFLVIVAGTSIWQFARIGSEIEGIAERDIPLTELPDRHPGDDHQEDQADRDDRVDLRPDP